MRARARAAAAHTHTDLPARRRPPRACLPAPPPPAPDTSSSTGLWRYRDGRSMRWPHVLLAVLRCAAASTLPLRFETPVLVARSPTASTHASAAAASADKPTGLRPRCLLPQPPGASTFRTGDLVFVRPHLDACHNPLDAGILETGAATIAWLRAQGVAVPGNETATHVAIARVNSSTGCLSFVQAVPPMVTETSALDFWHSTLPTTTFYRAWFRDRALQAQLAQAALAAATTQLGKPYAHDFEAPPSEFYCSSLVEWSFRTAASGRRVFLPPSVPDFTLIFEPRAFWEQYYKDLGLPLPVNVTGSNPTLLLHSPAMSYEAVDTTTRGVDGSKMNSAGQGDSTAQRDYGPGQTVTWSGLNWSVKDSQGGQAGPGPNYFSETNVPAPQEKRSHSHFVAELTE